MKNFFTELVLEIADVSWTLFKLMVPTLIVVKFLTDLGAVEYLAWMLGPVMSWVGLPDEMGLVWAATMLINMYAGFLILLQIPQLESLTVAQITVLSILMLIAHGLPVEARIAQLAGFRLRVTLLLRIGGALLLGGLMNQVYKMGGWLQEPHQLDWQAPPADSGWQAWLISQAENLLLIQIVIIALLTLLKILKIIGVERLMAWLLRPLLRLLGIGYEATTLTIVGVTLGLSFGGGLLIREVQAGNVSKQDIFAAMGLLAICHGIIEDTLLVLVMGADISGVLWARLIFSVLVIAVMTRVMRGCSDAFWSKHLVNKHLKNCKDI